MGKGKKIYCKATFLIGLLVLVITSFILFVGPTRVHATGISDDGISSEIDDAGLTEPKDKITTDADGLSIIYNNESGSVSTPIKMFLVLTVLSLAPSILIMLTSFTRIIVVLHFVRTAVGTQTAPPNQVLIGLSLFLTFFIMAPTFTKVYNEAIKPMSQNEITAEEAYNVGIEPIREFMFEQTNTKDIKLFLNIANIEDVENMNDIPTNILIPSFIVSELRTAFIIGFLIYIPFIVIDMVVASALMSMGMMMLPPTTISMPFKILLFILADGWNLIIGNVVKTFY